MRAAQFLATIGRGSKGSNALEVTEDRAGATSEQQDNVINTVNSLDPYGPSWQLVPTLMKEDVIPAPIPTSGLGDLTFTRASDATRTNSAGVIERTPWNLLQFSEEFSNAAWSKLGSSTIVANAAIAPNGTLTADSVTGAGSIILYQGLFRAQTYTQSCYAKAGTGNVFGIYFGASHRALFNLTNGTVTLQTGGTASIQSVGDGWYRCVLTATTTADQYVGPSFTPNGTVFIWGAQLVEGTSVLDYFPTTNRQDVPRIDFRNADGTLSSCGRLLLEPQRTNSIRNSTMVGAVAGSPGTLPTNYTASLAGMTQTIVGTGTENGLQYIDYRLSGTATGNAELRLEGNTIAASNGQAWTMSTYFKAISGAPNSTRLVIIERTSGGAYIVDGSTGALAVDSTLKQFTFTRTLAGGATVALVQPVIFFFMTNGATYDFTIRIAAPQMELGAYATTFIPTTTAAVTRVADSASKAGVSSIIGQTEGTIFWEGFFNAGPVTGFSLWGSNAQNSIVIDYASSTIQAYVNTSNVTRFNLTSGTISAGQVVKFAFAYKSGESVLYVNGTQIATSVVAFTFASTLQTINTDWSGYNYAVPQRKSINQAALFPTRLTNAQLAQLTTL